MNIFSNSLVNEQRKNTVTYLFLQTIVILGISFIVTLLIVPLYEKNPEVLHTIMELACIFVALASFLVFWLTHEQASPHHHLLGFGFLIVAIFDIFHTYHYQGLNLFPEGYDEISARYWVMGRMTEAVIILISIGKIFQEIKKWTGLLISIIFAMGTSLIILYNPGSMPQLLEGQSVTTVKVYLEYLIILIFVACLVNIRKHLHSQEQVTYRYVFMAALIAIPAELCFTLYTSLVAFSLVYGHVLKLAYYYFLFKGIFSSTVIYPHIKLEQTSRKLRSNNQYMRDTLNTIPMGLITFDEKLCVTFMNQRASEILELGEEELTGSELKQVAKEISAVQLPDIVRERSNEPLPRDKRILAIRNTNGKKITIKINRIFLEGSGMILMFDDAIKEQEFKNLRLQTETILRSVHHAIAITDRLGQVVLCNQALEDLVETSSKELIGRDKVYIKNLFKVQKERNDITCTDGSKAYEASFVTMKNNKRQALVHINPVFNEMGEYIGEILVGSNITELKQQQQFIQQQEKMAMLGQMASGIVHEIRNPLTTIKGFSQLIKPLAREAKLKEYVTLIEQEANEVNKVVTDFLTFARPHTPVLKQVSLNKLVLDMKMVIESQTFLDGIELNFLLSTDEPRVMIDEQQIKQVLLNIVKNAIEAMEDTASPKLVISTGIKHQEKQVFLSISDNGPGMSEETSRKIGTPFYTTKDKGTGLGLSICYQMIKEHQGRIQVTSESGEGTTFIILLPYQNQEKGNKELCQAI
ncbi:MASE3 domain-containing protein [Desulforamulus aquiferis]|uniref:histidine kinase n=1 Tax=Desulforamulus aquiferis TaxID=1397668 RepID=A0AAW7ZHS2_9FIRM|nr:MASE3 domain-containing protein [Desulforamulus aquiferis]MDO7788975.1 MASE3 domain-containing protein [Desulforamulus aquiferis]